MSYQLPIENLLEIVRRTHGNDITLQSYEVAPLEGGYVASSVMKIDLHLTDSPIQTLSFVQKHTTAAEVRTMKRLAEDIDLVEIPASVDWHVDTHAAEQNGANWFFIPFYEGSLLDFDDDLPHAVIRALARVHAYYANRWREFDWLPHVDTEFITGLLQYALSSLHENTARLPHTLFTEVAEILQNTMDSPVLGQVYEQLPKTLTHGDVHAGNIFRLDDDNHILFDWGNARIAPAMLDLANMVEMGSEAWNTYCTAWEAASGETLDPESAQLGYDWATALVNIQYLPFAITHLDPESVQHMAGKIQKSLTILQHRL